MMTKLCTMDGCERKHLARGLCRHHYDLARDPEERIKLARSWQARNPDRVRETSRRYYADHREEILRRGRMERSEDGLRSWKEYVRTLEPRSGSGYRGVTLHKPSGLWRAKIKHQNKLVSCRYHKTAEAAARAYDAKARELRGPDAYQNFPA